MGYYVFIFAAGGAPTSEDMREDARRQLAAGYWGFRPKVAYSRILKRGDQALIYVGRPFSHFIGRGVLVSGVRPWPHRKQDMFGGFDRGVTFGDAVVWERPLPRVSTDFAIRGPHGVHEIEEQRFFRIARAGEEAPDRLQPWAPSGLAEELFDPAEWSYVVVEDVVGEQARVAVSAWPSIDGAGMLRLVEEGEETVLLPRGAFGRRLAPATGEVLEEPVAGEEVARAFAVNVAQPVLRDHPEAILGAVVLDVTLPAYDALAAAVYRAKRVGQGAAVEPGHEDLAT